MKMQRTFATLALTLALLPSAPLAAHPPDAGTVETLALFNAAALETPESLAMDRDGNVYITLALTGEVRKVAPDGTQSTHALIPIGPPGSICGVFLNGLTGITIDHFGNLYASAAACDPANRGVWKIAPDGSIEILATLPLTGLPNGIVLRRDQIYVADTILGVIWRLPAEGGTAEIWLDDPLIAPPAPGAGGANGLQYFRGELYAANTGTGQIIAVPINPDGTAGTPRVHATLPGGVGCDDFALDFHGSLYCTTNPFNTVVRIDPDGTSEVLLTAADGLDGPTAAIFGRKGTDRFNLYITNGAFPGLTTTFQPSLMRLHLGVPGEPPNW